MYEPVMKVLHAQVYEWSHSVYHGVEQRVLFVLIDCYFSRDQFFLLCFEPILGVSYYFSPLFRTQV